MATVKKVRKSAAPYYGAAAVWIAWAALRDLCDTMRSTKKEALYMPHSPYGRLCQTDLLLRAVCKDEMTETVVPDPPKEEEKPTGNAGLDKMIAARRRLPRRPCGRRR